jgi:UDPglucose 6-dehydrogenase
VATKILPGLQLVNNVYDLAEDCDALVLLTEWNEFKQVDMSRIRTAMRQPIFIDGRNMYDTKIMAEHNFIYRGVGRGY